MYFSQIELNNRSNSGGALSAFDLVEERVEEKELVVEGNEKGLSWRNCKSLGVGFP